MERMICAARSPIAMPLPVPRLKQRPFTLSADAAVVEPVDRVRRVSQVTDGGDRAEFHDISPAEHLPDHRRDHGARRLPRTVGVERPDDDRIDAEGVHIGFDQLVRPDLGRRVGRLGLQGMRLVHGNIASAAIDLGRARMHEANLAAAAGRLQEIEGSADIGGGVARGAR